MKKNVNYDTISIGDNMEKFLEEVKRILTQITIEEKEHIEKAAKMMYDALVQDQLIHVFATGHSHMFCEELFYRSGGLVGINPILEPFLMQHEGAIRSTKFERMPGIAKILFESINVQEKEPFIIVSNSGINSVPVEMAEIVKANNHPLIVVTSLAISKNSKPRTKDNKKLYEIADIAIDNHIPYGDGVFDYRGTKIGSVSSLAGNYIAQSLVLEIIKLYNQNKIVAPIFQSANTIGGDEHNKILYQKYINRIKNLY